MRFSAPQYLNPFTKSKHEFSHIPIPIAPFSIINSIVSAVFGTQPAFRQVPERFQPLECHAADFGQYLHFNRDDIDRTHRRNRFVSWLGTGALRGSYGRITEERHRAAS
jgi:hypothetical protein